MTEIKKIDGYSNRAFFIDDNGYRFIVSYYTIVGYIYNGQFHRTWAGYSKTTVQNHIAKSGFYFSKKEFESLPVENLPGNYSYYDIVSFENRNRDLKLMTDNGRYWPHYSYGF